MNAASEIASEDANRLADAWIAAWNSRDLEAILAHYRNDVVYTSPAVRRWGGPSGGTLRGKDALRDHVRRVLERSPDLRLLLYHVAMGVGSITLVYRGVNGELAAETSVLDADLRIARVRGHHTPG